MILADKIITLRKKQGWSQEALAEKLGVSRQSVSKWEGALTTPDLDKILKLSQLFGVSTDYLLKEDLVEEEYVEGAIDTENPLRTVSMEEAHTFLSMKAVAAKRIAWATFLCILSPTPLLLLMGMAETQFLSIAENFAGGLGLILLITMIIPAVAIFIICGRESEPFQFLETESIDTAYGVSGMVAERKNNYKDTYTKYNVLGTCICIASAVPLFIGTFMTNSPMEELYIILGLCLTILMVGIGVFFFIIANVTWQSMQKLLEEGDYTKEKKVRNPSIDVIGSIYWLIATAIYLGYSLYTNSWSRSWIIWPVAGVLFAAFEIAYNHRYGLWNHSN